MSGLKQLRNRLKSIKSTKKITKAMQMVSAAKLNRFKEQAEELSDFSEVLGNIMADISCSIDQMDLPDNDKVFFSNDLKKYPKLFLLLSSERGLCGGFNSQVVKRLKRDVELAKQAGEEVKLIVIGKKGYDLLKNHYSSMIEAYYNLNSTDIDSLASEVRDKVISMVEQRKVGACYLYFNKFKNAITQVVTAMQILPAEKVSDSKESNISEYEYEGNGLLRDIINLYINGQVNYAMLQSRASEEGARMTAMDNATRNAGELVNKLTLKINRSRQAIITTELTEIISGAEAV